MKYLKYILQGLLFLLLHLAGYSQSNTAYFYYYKGEKIWLEVDTKTIALSIESEKSPETLKSLFINNKTTLSPITEDYTRSTLVTIDQQAVKRKAVKTYYTEITVTQPGNQADYKKQIEAYRNMPSVIMASPCFQTKEGKKMGLSNNFYVKLKDKKNVDVLYETAKKQSIEVLGHNEFMPLWFTLSCGKGTSLNALEAANLFYETGLFESAEPAFMLHDLLGSGDPYFNDQWGLKNTGQFGNAYAGIDIKAEQAWTITTGSAAIKTFVFDEGFEMNHPDLQANVSGPGYDATESTSPSKMYGPHGTACAGIIGAVQNNNLGMSGVAPNSKITSVSIQFSESITYEQLANGINWAWQNGADIISNSWAGGNPSKKFDEAITLALTYGRAGKGTVIVFLSHNYNGPVVYPASSNPRILVVGAISPCGERKQPGSCDGESWGSNYGTQLDVMAPGVKISTTDIQGTNGYDISNYTQTFNGTSAACPHVAGVAALMLSVNPDLTVQQVNDIIEQTAQKTRTELYNYTSTPGRSNGTWNNQMGYGLVNAYEAVVSAIAVACPVNALITANVITNNKDYRQASGTITASNTINSGATAIYHAGNEVILTAGFATQNGSLFTAYIEGCTGNYKKQLQAPVSEKITYDFRPGAKESESFGTNPVLTTNTLVVSPNPFTNKLVISYHLIDKNSKISLDVYSATGIKVASLFQNKQMAGGTHITEWNAGSFPAGIYLIVLTTDNGKLVRKVIKK